MEIVIKSVVEAADSMMICYHSKKPVQWAVESERPVRDFYPAYQHCDLTYTTSALRAQFSHLQRGADLRELELVMEST